MPRLDGPVMVAVLFAAAIFLFVDRHPMPILLWDESRNIVSALEMRRAGVGIVTTYAGVPDLWNTKPPLLIWLMTASMAAFGPSEWALRLPSTIAALGTLLLVLRFVRRRTGSIAIAALAATLLTLSPGFFGEHGARTADYDALLTFLTTASLMLGFGLVHRRCPRARSLALVAALVVGAVLTKGIAGLVPLAGVLPYLLHHRRLRRTLAIRWLSTAVAAALALIAMMLLLREVAAPGYLAASWYNDVAGRYARSLIGDAKPWHFYLDQLAAGYVAGIALLLLVPPALIGRRPSRRRLALGYSTSIALTLLFVVSTAGSKLSHYILPALPFMTIAAAIAVGELIPRWPPRLRWAGVLALLLVLMPAVRQADLIRYGDWFGDTLGGSGRYGELFQALPPSARATVVDRGFTLDHRPHYAAVLLAYRELAAVNGHRIGHATDPAAADRLHGIVASCDGPVVDALRRRGDVVAQAPGCVAIRR